MSSTPSRTSRIPPRCSMPHCYTMKSATTPDSTGTNGSPITTWTRVSHWLDRGRTTIRSSSMQHWPAKALPLAGSMSSNPSSMTALSSPSTVHQSQQTTHSRSSLDPTLSGERVSRSSDGGFSTNGWDRDNREPNGMTPRWTRISHDLALGPPQGDQNIATDVHNTRSGTGKLAHLRFRPCRT